MSARQKSQMSNRHGTEAVVRNASNAALTADGISLDSADTAPPPRLVERRASVRYANFSPHSEAAAARGRMPRIGHAQLQARRNSFKRASEAPEVPLLWALSKRGVDFVGSLALLMLLSPVLAALYALVARSGGDVIYGHRRIGRNGEWFTCYKFRTMVPDAENVLKRVLAENPHLQAEWDRDEKLRNDPRVTKVGEFLRRTSLDELPQLFNVLKGDMSLVGPRPATDVGKAHYGRAWRWYLAVRPGMTGLWQVSGRNDVGFRRLIVLDVYYIRNQNLLLDLQILFRTIRVVFGSTGY